MHLGFITEPTANGYYRAVFPMRALERRGHTVVWPRSETLDAPMRDLYACDLVHCYRRTDRLADLRTLRERGVAISFDNDDDFAAAEASEEGLRGQRFNKAIFKEILQAVRLADLATTPSDALAERYRSTGAKNVRVIENHLSSAAFGFGSRGRHEGIVVGWVAGREHRVDLERIPIAEALRDLLAEYNNVRVVTVGLQLPLHSEHYRHITFVDLPELLTVIGGFDIGIAPLTESAFNRARSNIKLKEYASAGVCWLASPVGPYRTMGEREGGELVADDAWSIKLRDLVDSQRRRRHLSKRALRWAKSQVIENNIQGWESAFADAIDSHRIAQRRPPRTA